MREKDDKNAVNIAILGFGVVGSGVAEVFEKNGEIIDKKALRSIRIKKILDLRDFPASPWRDSFTKNFLDILNDESISVVVEAMGGLEPAYPYVKACLLAGKSVVTSNKAIVAKYGAELIETARSRHANFLFEASVGGGIPIIRPLNHSLAADRITEITGILNGTTNYILTKMHKDDMSFQAALKNAQELGFAEKNPKDDVEGHDTCRKIAILLSLATGKHVSHEDIFTEGITNVSRKDTYYARKLGSTIKLIATGKIGEDGVCARVAPALVSNSHPLSTVDDSFNAVFVRGNIVDEAMFYGRGAGKLPTAGAIVADVIDAARHIGKNIMSFWSNEKCEMAPFAESMARKMIRVEFLDKEKAKQSVADSFGDVEIVEIKQLYNEFAFVCPRTREKELDEKTETLRKAAGIIAVQGAIRVYED